MIDFGATSRVRLVFCNIIISSVVCGHSVWAQDVDGSSRQAEAGTVRGQVSGVGIRGAMPDLPEGWLVTTVEAREFGGEEGFKALSAPRVRALNPLIEILKPDPVPDLKVKSPFAIAVQFKSLADAPIDPATFKVMYGALKIDITNRITKFVKVTKDGFALDNAQIPAGRHRLTLQVVDEKQRVAERELRLEVE